MDGGAGNDTFIISRGTDVIHGKDGFDVLDFSAFSSVGISLNLATGVFTSGADQTTFTNIEGAIGTAGDDTLSGGLGNDVFSGGSGMDRFVFAFNSGIDQVTDFTATDDTFVILASSFANLDGSHLAAGAASADYVILSHDTTLPGAPTSTHGYILATSDALYWDNDGNGANEAVQFASFNTTTDLTLNDFWIS